MNKCVTAVNGMDYSKSPLTDNLRIRIFAGTMLLAGLTALLLMIPVREAAAQTNQDGYYLLHRMPAIEQQLTFRTPGYVPQQGYVQFQSGEPVLQMTELFGDRDQGDRISVQLRQRGQAQALARQLGSPNYRSVLAQEQMDRFGDRTLEDVLGRFPGVQMDRRGQINVRGAGQDRLPITVNGQRLATSGLGDRSMDPAMFSYDMTHKLELIRVLTPDMDAEGLGGVVNMHTRRAHGEDRDLRVRLGGGGDTRYFNQSGVTGIGALYYSELISEDISMAVNLSWHLDYRPFESLGIDYQAADFGDGQEDVIDRVSPALHTDDRNRLGGSLQLNYIHSDRSHFFIKGMFNQHDRDMIRHKNSYSAGSDWIRPDSTGATGSQGRFDNDVQFKDMNVEQYLIQTKANHFFDSFDLQYSLGWAYTRSTQEWFEFPFGVDGLNYAIDMSDRTRPQFTVTNLPLREDGVLDQRRLRFQDFDRIYDKHVDNSFSARVDVQIPFGPVSLKAGSSALLTNKKGDYEDHDYRYFRLMRLDRFDKLRFGAFDVFDEYYFLNFVNAHSARSFYEGNIPSLMFDEDWFQYQSAVWNYEAAEHIYAGYAMFDFRLGGLTLIGGARVEYTDGRYEGRKASFAQTGALSQITDTTHNANQTYLYPHIQLGYAPGERTHLRGAYSRSIARPDFNRLAPFERRSLQDSTLFRGNPYLEPMISDNLDVWFEHYFATVGVLSVGGFHKQLENFMYLRNRQIEQGADAGWQESRFENNDETATLYGVEISWQQWLNFLPGVLSNLSVYGNYAWTSSTYNVDFREDEVALPGQSPHVVNAALTYDQGRFSTQVSYHWTSESLSLIGQDQFLPPSADTNTPIYRDRYVDSWSDVSFSFRFRIAEQFRFWADVYNLLNRERIAYEYDRVLYPVETEWIGGRTFQAGIRFDL